MSCSFKAISPTKRFRLLRSLLPFRALSLHFGPKFGKEGAYRCRPRPNFNAIWERRGPDKRNRVDIFCRLSTMHNAHRETNSLFVSLSLSPNILPQSDPPPVDLSVGDIRWQNGQNG